MRREDDGIVEGGSYVENLARKEEEDIGMIR
jgi:hypothetical protein